MAMNSCFNPYDLYQYLKKEESTFEEIERAIRLFSRKLPAYEYLIRKYMTDEYCRAVVVRSDGIEEPHYRIIGYDAERRSVFLQAKTGLYGSTKNQEVKHLDIEEFIFGLYLIWNVIDPVEQYTLQKYESSDEELPF